MRTCPAASRSIAALAIAANAADAREAHGRSDSSCAARPRQGRPLPGRPLPQLTDGAFRGTPVGTGAYSGSIELNVADAFPNGEGGVCAPIARRHRARRRHAGPARARRVVGDSCQDGAGNPATSSFTGLARFVVKYGTGAYAKAYGGGLATFSEDAADRDRMTLIGSIVR